jgi:acetolactate synthase I/II/III large subunit
LKQRADLVVVIGTPLDFRVGFGRFGDATVAHVVDAPTQVAGHVDAVTVVGDIAAVLRGLADHAGDRVDHAGWLAELRDAEEAARAEEAPCSRPAANTSSRPACTASSASGSSVTQWWCVTAATSCRTPASTSRCTSPAAGSTPGPYGCLGNGLGSAIAARVVRPDSQVVLMLGDGAAGFSLMDVDTLVRHQLPVVMVVGNNGIWGLEKHPMQFIYGWDMACDLQPNTRYDEVVTSLGGAGETVTDPDEVGPALDRAFASGVPYLVNVMTDPGDVYPRTSNLA